MEEDLIYGCHVTHKINHLECCFTLDELGRNISQKGDGHVGGQLPISVGEENHHKKVSVSGQNTIP